MTKPLETITIEPPISATACVIWLHGLGADGHDFEGIVPHLGLPQTHSVRFVFPHAPMQAVTINGGMAMRAWYDIYEMSIAAKIDTAGIRQSSDAVAALVSAQRDAGIASENIVLAGFSQGGVITSYLGLRYAETLAGLMILSSYLPLANAIESEAHPANRDIDIFWGHGTADPVVPIVLAEQAIDALTALDYRVNFNTYPMPHSVSQEEIADISTWLKKVLQISNED